MVTKKYNLNFRKSLNLKIAGEERDAGWNLKKQYLDFIS